MNLNLNEDIRISNNIFNLCFKDSKKCNKTVLKCFKNKLISILIFLKQYDLKHKKIPIELLHQFHLAILDVSREIMKFDANCNSLYKRLITEIITIIKKYI